LDFVIDGLRVAGVDEAGRGSIIGPLVVAGLSIRESRMATLKEMGVRDSKTLTPKARARLFGKIVNVAETISILKIPPQSIDESVSVKGLNRLEAKTMAQVVNDLNADEVYVDCCDTNTDRYKQCISQYLTCEPVLHSMHHADSLNVVVSAASIIAKITRDQELREIRKKHRNIGSGYPADERTMSFIRRWVDRNGCAPEFARKSWKPLKALLAKEGQKTLRYSAQARVRPARTKVQHGSYFTQ
jgi:ribonuclease HII